MAYTLGDKFSEHPAINPKVGTRLRPIMALQKAGIVATWWVGVTLGVPLATFARNGSRPKITADALVRPIIMLFAFSAILAVLAGHVGYIAASMG